jgi:hypothetical protein
MKKIVFGIFISMLMIGSIFASANIAEFKKVEQTNNNISFFKIEDSEITVKIPIGSYEIKETVQGDEINVEDFGHLLIPGKPNLPSKIFSIAIPPGAILFDVKINSGIGTTLDGIYDIKPVNVPIVMGEEDPEVSEQKLKKYNENYEAVYGNNNPYPLSVAEFERTAGYRKYNLVDVRVNPFTYQPISKKLTFYPDITVTISFTFPEGFTYENIMIDNIEKTEQFAEEIILNYNQAKDWYPSGKGSRETYDYIIITLQSLESSITPLVEWEEAKGRNVYVATTTWINSNYDGYDLAEKMRNFLRDKYPAESWGVLDVCLIGNYDDVPMRLTTQDSGYGQPETDYYYAELSLSDDDSWDANSNHQWGEDSDPIDFYGEVIVGRIPWSDPETVEHICEKSVAYEQNEDSSFKKNILLIGTFFWPDTDNAVLMELKVNSEDHPWMEDWTMTRMYEDAESQYECDYDANYDNVKTVWSQGTYAFVDWAGHGSPTACYEYYPQQPFVDTDTCNDLNDDYPAIIFADACSNSDTDDDNIGQMMLKQGAIGFLGATKVAYGFHDWNDPMDGTSESLDYFFTTCCTSGNYTQGQAHQYALTEMYVHDLWYYQYYESFEWGALWGNPDLGMAPVVTSDAPENPEKPSGQDKGIPNVEFTFSTSTSDPNGDQVYYMWSWGDGDLSDWIGPFNSNETVEASHSWSNVGIYEIKVIAKDVFNAKSDWSEPLVISIGDNQPPANPTIKGPSSGNGGKIYKFTFVSTDPDGHDIYYYIDWDDGLNTGWIGPYNSGEQIALNHSWNKKGEYLIKAWAKDIFESESGQGNFRIKILTNGKTLQKNQGYRNLLFQIIGHFPLLEKLLNL